MVKEYFKSLRKDNEIVTPKMLQTKALEVKQKRVNTMVLPREQEMKLKKFKASRKWAFNFMQRN